MPLVQNIDQKKFKQGSGFNNNNKILPYKSLNNRPIYLVKKGSSFDFSSLIDTAKKIGNVINDNKDTIQNVSATIGSVANAGKSIADTIKVSKELEKLKTIEEIRKKKRKKPKEIVLTQEQTAALQKIGSGFYMT